MGGFAIVGPKLVSIFGHHSRPARAVIIIIIGTPYDGLCLPYFLPLYGTRRRVAYATARYGETLLCQLPSQQKHTGMMLQQSTGACARLIIKSPTMAVLGYFLALDTLTRTLQRPADSTILERYLLCSILPRLWGMLSVGGIALLVDHTRA
jgi:hypothetical protein